MASYCLVSLGLSVDSGGGSVVAGHNFTFTQIFLQIFTDLLAARGEKVRSHLPHARLSQPTWSRMHAGRSALSLEQAYLLCASAGVELSSVLDKAIVTVRDLEAREGVLMMTARQTEAVINRNALRFLIERISSRSDSP